MLQQELYRKHMQDEQGRRKKELLEQVLARQAAAAEGKRYTLEEAQQIDADLRAAEAAAKADYEETVPSAPKEKEPELLKAVKLEPADEDWIEEVKELSSLRMCNLCNTRNYLRQGLCCNMYCQAFFMLDPHAGKNWLPGASMSMGQSGAHMTGRSMLMTASSAASLPKHFSLASRSTHRSWRRPCCPLHKWRGQPPSLLILSS